MTRFHLVGTYHKAGTIWMRNVFSALCKKTNLLFIKNFTDKTLELADTAQRACAFNDHSLFPKDFLYRDDVRILHVIRDPRNMLVSGVHYHQRAPTDREKWLHIPRSGLNGLSYQQHLLSLENMKDKFLFEIQNSHRANMELMRTWDYNNPRSVEVKYERLMEDTDGSFFLSTLIKLGFTETEAQIGRSIFLERHTRLSSANSELGPTGHIRRRETDWREELPYEVALIYAERYGQDLIALGYERDFSWVESTRATVTS